MIQKLKQTENYRSFLQTDTGDVIMQGNPGSQMIGRTDDELYFPDGYYEVIIRGDKSSRYAPDSVSGNINHKRQIVRVLRRYSDDEVEKLSETDLNGILRDYRSADIRNNSK